jgi:hypothetical protein
MRLANDLARALEPESLMRELGLTPDPWQAELLASDAKRWLLCCCRQSGKSTTTALIGLHEALFTPLALVLLVSPSLRQSSELFRKVADAYHQLSDVAEAVQESTLRLELPNGSRVIALPGSETTIRGYSRASLIVLDEAARVSDELVAAIRPALATNKDGRLICLSTPWGKRGYFYQQWAFGGDDWKRVLLTAPDCPRISAEFLAEERKQLGEFLWSQEYMCTFLDNQSAVFSSDLIQQALTDEVQPLWQ